MTKFGCQVCTLPLSVSVPISMKNHCWNIWHTTHTHTVKPRHVGSALRRGNVHEVQNRRERDGTPHPKNLAISPTGSHITAVEETESDPAPCLSPVHEHGLESSDDAVTETVSITTPYRKPPMFLRKRRQSSRTSV